MRLRGFEIAKGWETKNINLPKRSTKFAAAYDIEAAEDVVLPVFRPSIQPTFIPTGLKAYCQPDEFYMICNRSSGPSKFLVLANGVGIIDADYYNNPSNDGHIQIIAYNMSDQPVHLQKGTRIAQIIFQKYLITDDDSTQNERQGGIGSTD